MVDELTEFLVKAVVRDPDAVEVVESERRGEPGLLIRVSEDDRGVVIGRQGRTIRAIQTIVNTAAGPGHSPGLDVESV